MRNNAGYWICWVLESLVLLIFHMLWEMAIFELILICTFEKDFVPFESFKLWSTYEYWAYALIYTLCDMYRCHYKNVTKNAEYLIYPPQPPPQCLGWSLRSPCQASARCLLSGQPLFRDQYREWDSRIVGVEEQMMLQIYVYI